MKNELCYPFLYEASKMVEFEILTDKLASQLGFCASMARDDFQKELLYITKLVYHLNGSIRGKIAITKTDVLFLKERYVWYEQYTNEGTRFVLPQGSSLATSLHVARSMAKEVVRKMHQVRLEGIAVDDVLFAFANMVSNYCFMASFYANKINNVPEIEFKSKSYQ